MGTPAANQFEAVLSARFPGIRFGRVNCRKIANRELYSQHSWNNGRDIYPPIAIKYGGGPGSPAYAPYKAYLDAVYAFIKDNLYQLNINHMLWQKAGHYNHIHADFWPEGSGVPPCAGGELLIRYPGRQPTHADFTLINTYSKEELDMNLKAFVRAAFSAGNPAVQGDINYWLGLADTDPYSDEWEDLFRAALTPTQ